MSRTSNRISVSKKDAPISSIKQMKLQAGEAEFPSTIQPMLASLAKGPFDEPGWIYEVKWDGFRAMVFSHQGSVDIRSRNGKSFNEQFYPLYELFQSLKLPAVVDGEIVVVDKNGRSDFGKLQNWRSEADGDLVFYAFDLIWFNGHDLSNRSLLERKQLLSQLLPKHELIRTSLSMEAGGFEAFRAAQDLGLEGIIAKKDESTYLSGKRTKDWLKIKTHKRQEVVIGGFTVNEGSPRLFSSILAGVYDEGKLLYTGKVGTGFNKKMQAEMMEAFQPLIVDKCPFIEIPDVNLPSRFRPDPPHAKVTWLQPVLVAEVSYAELTKDRVMRHPSFEGMRSDKNAKDVFLEKEVPIPKDRAQHPSSSIVTLSPTTMKDRKSLLNPKDETQVRELNGRQLKFTNLSKLFWPEDGLTKRDMLQYYYQIAPYLLPYLQDRPLTLNRHPNGINGKSFYQKDVKGKVPEWIDTFPYHSEGDDRDKQFLVCTSEESILYVASLGCIEMNPWSSRTQSPDNPDWCIIDLDPDKNTFQQVIETAQVTRAVLEEAGVPCYCKTSGSTGLHIYIPLGACCDYESSKELARKIVKLVHHRLPKFTSIERKISDRKGKLYLDFLQNRPQATVAAPFSLRPKPGATVSMPLHWEEVKKGLKMSNFTMTNSVKRIKKESQLFAPVLGEGIDVAKADAVLSQMLLDAAID